MGGTKRAGRRSWQDSAEASQRDLPPSATESVMGKAIEELVHFVAGTPWETIPGTVREHAKLVLLDTLGVTLAGSVQPEVAGVRARLTATGGRGATVYAPGWPTTDPRTAALLNGLAGRSIELCEGHRYVSCQGAVQILPTALNVAGGMSGFAGVLAPELALAGVAAQPNAIEEAFGRLVGDGFRPEALTEELGQRWEIARNYFRLRACCNPIYAALDALESILTEEKPLPESIARVDVATYRFAANMREPAPINYFAAKYSLPHAAAALILRGNAGYHAFTEEAVADPAIAAIRRRVAVREDPALNASVPRLKPARVTVTFTDGRQVTRLRESARSDFQDPYREDEVRAKFRELAGVVLSPGAVTRVEELVERLDELERLSDLVVALTL